MFDVIVKFLDVNFEYEENQSLLVKFEYGLLVSLLAKAKDRLRIVMISPVLVQLSFWDCIEAVAEDSLDKGQYSQRETSKYQD